MRELRRALVTGSNGFIGRNLCEKLVEMKLTVVGLDDLSEGLAINDIDGVEYVRGNVGDSSIVKAIISDLRPQAVFHLAGKPKVSGSVESPVSTAETNLMGVISVLDAIAKTNSSAVTRLILASSSSVYGGATKLPTSEDIPTDPQSPYALQKKQAEEWCKLFSRTYKVETVVLRYFNVFGPHSLMNSAYSAVLSAWIYSLVVDPAIEPYLEGNGSQTRDFTFVDNVVQANLLAATHSSIKRGEVFNIGQGQAHSLLECKSLIEQLTGQRLNLEMRPTRIGDVQHSLADITKAKSVLRYNPITNFSDQLNKMIEWYRTDYPVAAY